MGGKYSAEWWEKILEINREGQARHSQSFVAELVQARASRPPRRPNRQRRNRARRSNTGAARGNLF